MSPGWAYLLQCADDTYSVGSTTDLERRLYEHETGAWSWAYTRSRRPVKLVWCQEFPTIEEACAFERQVHGWSRAKKEALIQSDWDGIHRIVKEERKDREKRKSRRVKDN